MFGVKKWSDECDKAMEWGVKLFTDSVRRGVNNAVMRNIYWKKQGPTHEKSLGNFFIQIDENTSIHLTDLRIVGYPAVRISEISLNMDSINLNVALSLDTIRLEAQYEVVNIALARLLPVFNVGKAIFLIENLQARGQTALRSIEDSLVSDIYDLTYSSNEFRVRVENPEQGQDIENNLTCTELDKSIVKKFWRELTRTLNQHIFFEMCEPIVDVSVCECLLSETKFSREVNRYSDELSAKVSCMVSAVLEKATVALGQQITTPGMSAVFTRKSLQRRQSTLRETGMFVGSGGYLTAINSMRKKQRHTLIKEGSHVTHDQNGEIFIIAQLEFSEFKLHYEHYNVTIGKDLAQGKMTLNMNENTSFLKFKLLPQADNKFKPEFVEFTVQSLGNCSLDINELGSLDTLVPDITTWTVGTMWEKIVPKIETDVSKVFKKSIEGIIFHSELNQ